MSSFTGAPKFWSNSHHLRSTNRSTSNIPSLKNYFVESSLTRNPNRSPVKIPDGKLSKYNYLFGQAGNSRRMSSINRKHSMLNFTNDVFDHLNSDNATFASSNPGIVNSKIPKSTNSSPTKIPQRSNLGEK
jgi:hypothetical protein